MPEEYTKGDSYENGVVYEYTVRGIGNYTGSFAMQLAVVRDKNLDFTDAVVALDKKQYEYRGKPLGKADVQITSVKLGKTTLEPELYEYAVCAENAGNGFVEFYPSERGREAGYRGYNKVKIKVVGDRSIKDVALGSGWKDTIVFSQRKVAETGGICQEENGLLVFVQQL